MTTRLGEEQNYIRISLLLTRVSPRAVRCTFDREFAPAALPATIQKEYHKLSALKGKRIINQAQWNVLHPRNGIPDSKNFDVTLMICLLRNISLIAPPSTGFDSLPPSGEISAGADLARIRYYRNYLAKLNDTDIDNSIFTSAWNDVADAVGRLGGQSMVYECMNLKVCFLDHSKKEIVSEIQQSKAEIKEVRESLEGRQDKMEKDIDKIKAALDDQAKDPDLLIPTCVRVGRIQSTNIEMQWEPPKCTSILNLRGYKITCREKEDDTMQEDKESVTVSLDTRCYNIVDLRPWTKYKITIQAYSDRGNLPNCKINVKTQEEVPSMPPENIRFFKTAHSIDAFWEPPSILTRNGNIIKYTVYYETEDGEKKAETTSACRIVLQNLQPSTNYKVSIDCQTAVGKGPASEQQDVRTSEVTEPTVHQTFLVQSKNTSFLQGAQFHKETHITTIENATNVNIGSNSVMHASVESSVEGTDMITDG